ncbi:MAG: elongation factor P-like protein EfpL [bacterium]
MPKASDVKRGQIIEYQGDAFSIKALETQSPSARGAVTLYKLTLQNLKTGQRILASVKGDEMFGEVDYQKVAVQYSYQDSDGLVFMNMEDYSQYTLDEESVSEQKGYLTEGLEGIILLLIDGLPVGIEVPGTVELEVIETAPVMKGASATKSAKPATTNTGIEILVPDYLSTGERIKVNTSTGKFMSRA